MYISSPFLIAALGSIACAQTTPQRFTPATSAKLEVVFNSTAVNTPGQLLSKTTTSTQPQIALSNVQSTQNETYMFIMLDLDVPPQGSSTKRRVLLHALTTGFKATQQRITGSGTLLASPQKGPAMYIPPGPPATDTIAHRYVELLFRQPANLNVQASDFANITGRFNFDVVKFMAENQVGAPVAGNFFTVDGRANATAASGSGTATGSGGIARNTLVPFEGAAGRREVAWGFVGMVGGLAVVVM
ncbi:PEBP-like protein [Ophiobolus disseminans]|uniref:PEBP-like protein n=1 Tax=Ophiobolus disseminans TaxID=1469910 RepID=A0A6A7A127_9PLEO|nr:PEBP-like protein [Ophiobolus disseminans]